MSGFAPVTRCSVPRRIHWSARAFAARSLLLFGFWLLLLEPDSLAPVEVGADWLVGALAAAGATLMSLRLLPPAPRGPRAWLLARNLLRFLIRPLLGGLAVARWALDPRLPFDPGRFLQPTALRGATRRALFGALTRQIPGTLAVELDDPEGLLYLCLDWGQHAAHGQDADQALFQRLRGGRAPTDRGPGR